MKTRNGKKWIKEKSTAFCPGCQYGIALNCLGIALEMTEMENTDVVFVSGIGCAGWIPDQYIKANTVHINHGRTLPVATGIKLARPALNVIVVSGDGDLATIGTNHLVHAARRDMNITVICLNNFVYGMTGGQAGATTPQDAITSTTKEGNEEKPLDLMQLVLACGCSFSARYPALYIKAPRKIPSIICKAIKHQGFSFVEIIAPCATHFTKRNPLQLLPLAYGRFKSLSEYLQKLGENDK